MFYTGEYLFITNLFEGILLVQSVYYI